MPQVLAEIVVDARFLDTCKIYILPILITFFFHFSPLVLLIFLHSINIFECSCQLVMKLAELNVAFLLLFPFFFI